MLNEAMATSPYGVEKNQEKIARDLTRHDAARRRTTGGEMTSSSRQGKKYFLIDRKFNLSMKMRNAGHLKRPFFGHYF